MEFYPPRIEGLKKRFIFVFEKTPASTDKYRNDMKTKLFILLSVLIYSSDILAQELFPDGTPISEWFREYETTDVSRLGRQYRLIDHGVACDSTLIQTNRIQAVIDKAHTDGGGVIVVPRGTFLTGSLFFKPDTHLYLEENARLKGSDDISDFKLVTTRIEGQTVTYFAALVNADGMDGFTISGRGTIDGNGSRYWRAFWLRRQWNRQCTNMDEQRPRLVYVSNSRNVHISGVRLINSPFWTSHYYNCQNLKITGVHIHAGTADLRAPSSDGIDIDVCENVLIRDCNIAVNDDAIALKGGKYPTAAADPNNGPNRNILIENNIFNRCPALTLGSESVHTRNVIMRNCRVDNAPTVLLLKMRPDTPQNHEYILIEDCIGTALRFFAIEPWTQFFDLKGHPVPRSSASRIVLRDCEVECSNVAINIRFSEQYTLSNFNWERLTLSEGQPSVVPVEKIENLRVEQVTINGKNMPNA
jgi:hypothetical protein